LEGFFGTHNRRITRICGLPRAVDVVRALSAHLCHRLIAHSPVYLGRAAPSSSRLETVPIFRLWCQYGTAWLAVGNDPAGAPRLPRHAGAGRDLRTLGAMMVVPRRMLRVVARAEHRAGIQLATQAERNRAAAWSRLAGEASPCCGED